MNENKVCIVGLGGVGGYLEGMLAHYLDNIYFYIRGARLKSIKNNGFKLYTETNGEFTAYPKWQGIMPQK